MDLFDELKPETKRTEEEIHKAEMKKEIGDLNGGISRIGHGVSREMQKSSPAPSETVPDE